MKTYEDFGDFAIAKLSYNFVKLILRSKLNKTVGFFIKCCLHLSALKYNNKTADKLNPNRKYLSLYSDTE